MHEDAKRYRTGIPIATARHVLLMCDWRGDERARSAAAEWRATALTEVKALTGKVPVRDDTAALRTQLGSIRRGLQGDNTEGCWQALRDALAGFVCEFMRGPDAEGAVEERRTVLAHVTRVMLGLQAGAAEVLCEWEARAAGEVWRRGAQDELRGLLRVILRAWREHADPRGARTLRRTWDATEVSAGWRCDVLPAAECPAEITEALDMEAAERRTFRAYAVRGQFLHLRHDGRRVARVDTGWGHVSALPAGSFARLWLTPHAPGRRG